MALSNAVKNLLNTISPGAKKAKLGDLVDSATTTKAGTVLKGAAVANAAGANPTKAEFDALLVSLRNAGHIAP